MRLAALYDVHGNLPALEAVLRDVRAAGVDEVIVGGDVMPGPMGRECLERLQALEMPTAYVMGNGDRETLAARDGIASDAIPPSVRPLMHWCAEQLTSEQAAWIATWPATVRRALPTLGDVLFCHATPQNDTDIFTRRTAEERLRSLFDAADARVVVCGHTHMPFDRMIGATRVVNAGSVGMPFGVPGAYWLLLGDAIELRQTSYDLDAAAARVRTTRFPQAEVFAAGSILRPPSEEPMLAFYAKAERA